MLEPYIYYNIFISPAFPDLYPLSADNICPLDPGSSENIGITLFCQIKVRFCKILASTLFNRTFRLTAGLFPVQPKSHHPDEKSTSGLRKHHMVAIDLLALPLDLHLTALLKLESRKLGQQLNVHCNALDKKGKCIHWTTLFIIHRLRSSWL